MMHKQLVDIAAKWLKNRCSVVFSEFATYGNESPDVIGWKSGCSTMIECKTSRSDFLRDAKKLTRRNPDYGMGQHRYYLCIAGIIEIDDLPPGWGLLWVKNGRVRMKCACGHYFKINQNSEIIFLVSMLRRTQCRLGQRDISDWLRWENRKEARESNI